jgi:hypothetical protein
VATLAATHVHPLVVDSLQNQMELQTTSFSGGNVFQLRIAIRQRSTGQSLVHPTSQQEAANTMARDAARTLAAFATRLRALLVLHQNSLHNPQREIAYCRWQPGRGGN